MRYIIILLFACSVLSAQDFDPPSMTFTINGSQRTLNVDSLSQDTTFIRGWQWGGHWRLDRPMSLNAHLGSGYADDPLANPNEKFYFMNSPSYIRRFDGRGTDYIGGYYNAAAMEYSPALLVHNPGVFETNPADPRNPIFGFKYRDSNLTVGSNDVNLRLLKNQFTTKTKILDTLWLNDQLTRDHGGNSDGVKMLLSKLTTLQTNRCICKK